MINFEEGEVLEVNDDRSIKVKIFSDYAAVVDSESATVVTAYPSKRNIHLSPLKGEIVILCLAASSNASANRQQQQYYYVDILGLQNSIHHNSLPTVTNRENNERNQPNNQQQNISPTVDDNFAENINIDSHLQSFSGDLLYEGRFGNSVRLGATPKNNNTSNYSDKVGSPITILRNTFIRNKGTVIEDFINDDSIIALTSGQRLKFEQSSKNLKALNSVNNNTWNSDGFGNSPTILLSSGRIFLNSKDNEIVLSAKNGISLTTETSATIDAVDKIIAESKRIELGLDANEPLVLGNQFKQWMNELIAAIGTITVISPSGICSPLTASIQWALVETIKAKIDLLLSEIAFTKKLNISIPKLTTTNQINSETFKLTPTNIQQKSVQQTQIKESETIDDLTIDEKNTLRDLYNKNEKELKEGSFVNVLVDEDVELVEREDYVYGGEVEDTDGIPLNDIIDEEPISDFEWDYEFLEPLTVSKLSNKPKSAFIEQKLSANSIKLGKKVAELALADINTADAEKYLKIINCRKDKGDWQTTGAVATWWKSANLPLPSSPSLALSWYDWAIRTNRFATTPVIGAVAIYGTETDKVHAHSLAIVVSDSIYVEVVDSIVSKTAPRTDAIIGYILPSDVTLNKPKVSFHEDNDGAKEFANIMPKFNQSTDSNRISAIDSALSAVFDYSNQSHGACARYTMNLAFNFIAAYTTKYKLTQGATISAGGSANSSAFHSNLQKLGYSKQYLGEMSKAELKKLLSESNFSIGDVVTYRCIDGSLKTNPKLYGHAQIFTNKKPSGWACDQANNYGTSFVYNSSTSADARFVVTYFSIQ